MDESSQQAEMEAKASKLIKNLRKRAEKEGIDANLLDCWSAHVSGANEVCACVLASRCGIQNKP